METAQTSIVALPSPFWDSNEFSAMVQGKDMTKTMRDFDYVVQWSLQNGFGGAVVHNLYLKDGVYNFETYYALIKQIAFNPLIMFTVGKPCAVEYAIWYFSGHGMHKDIVNIAEHSGFTLNRIQDDTHSRDLINQYLNQMCEVKSRRYLQGGELVFQRYGYFDFNMLIEMFETAIKDKENKHILVVLDSCFSGIFGKHFEKWAKGDGYETRWKNKHCSLTLQTAASEEEPTYGGYFTPLYIKLQKVEFQREMLKKWNDSGIQAEIIDMDLPSPQLYSTNDNICSAQGPLVQYQNDVWLVKDSNFFKMCYVLDSERNSLAGMRTLSETDAKNFFSSIDQQKVVDFKLRTTRQGMYADSPMGLFLIEYSLASSTNCVCVHIHFQKGNTSQVGRINLEEHCYDKDKDLWLPSCNKFELFTLKTKSTHKQVYWNWENDTFHYWEGGVCKEAINITPEYKRNAQNLLSTCKSFVLNSAHMNWGDSRIWTMKGSKPSFFGMFKYSLERSLNLKGTLALMGYKDHPNDALHEAWRSDYDLDTMKSLLKEKEDYDPSAIDKDGFTALHVAALSGKLEFVKYLIDEKKLNSSKFDVFGRTSLHLASHGGHLPVVRYLVEKKKCDITIKDANDNTPLDIASGDVRNYFSGTSS